MHWVHKISYWWTEPPLSKALQSSVKSVLLYTELSIQAAFIIWASEVMREQHLREIALQTAVQISVTTHEERARQREFDKQKGQSTCATLPLASCLEYVSPAPSVAPPWWACPHQVSNVSTLSAPRCEDRGKRTGQSWLFVRCASSPCMLLQTPGPSPVVFEIPGA